MELSEILKQPDGFTPPDVTVKIEKVYDYKSGHGDNGPWSFQNLQVTGGKLKLKGLPEFPTMREGQTVTLRANQSRQHGLTGMKVSHEQYQGKTYDYLLITNSAKWEWANGQPATQPTLPSPAKGMDVSSYVDHLLSCASLANQVTTLLGIQDEAAMQASFATICIDTKNRGILLPKDLPASPLNAEPEPPQAEAPEPPENWTDDDVPF